ncbi:MAG: hypothetical protein JNL67_09330 [Planctomycetaceae bacterium]|nr:hypothetical protein [Planctomycetaceae bacterium]
MSALVFFATFLLLLSRTIYLDANEILSTRVDLMGFVVMGIAMLPRLISSDVIMRVKTIGVTLIAVFLFYLLIALIAADREILPVLMSRHGLVPWLLVGFMAAVATEDITAYVANSRNPLALSLGLIGPPMVLLIPAYAIRDASEGIVETISYQQVAGSATILMVGVVLIMQSLWKTSVQARATGLAVISATIYISTSMVLTYLIAKLQSTSIVLVFLALSCSIGFLVLRHVSIVSLFGLVLTVAVLGFAFVPELLTDLLETTRFSALTEGDWMISSVRARLSILELFWDQWASSPFTGDYVVEERIGGHGNYVHSLPLSLLTHLGVFGFAIFAWAFYFVSRSTNGSFRPSLLTLIVFAISTVSTFFSWTPVWFMLGASALFSSEKSPA